MMTMTADDDDDEVYDFVFAETDANGAPVRREDEQRDVGGVLAVTAPLSNAEIEAAFPSPYTPCEVEFENVFDEEIEG